MSLVFAGPETQGFFQRRCTRWLAVAIVVTGLCISGQDPSLADVKDLENVTVRGVYDPNALRLHLVQMEGAYGLMEKLNPTQGLQAPAEPDTNDRAVNERDCEETENPVVLASGNKVLDQADFSTAPGDFSVSRTYSRAGGFFNGFGSHWTWSFNYFLLLEPNPGWSPICQPGTFEPGVPCPLLPGKFTTITAVRPDGRRYAYTWSAATQRYEDSRPASTSWITEELWSDPAMSAVRLNREDGGHERYTDTGRITA
jgi:hypothetical protein